MTDDWPQVGDEIAFAKGFGGGWVIHTIVRLTPSGRIVCSNGRTLSPDLRILGKCDRWGPYRGEKVTEKIRERVLREYLSGILAGLPERDFTNEQLQKIVDLVESFV
jgi:hypothetical protein